MNTSEYFIEPVRIRSAVLLTARERDILELSGQGMSMKSVAMELGISPGTVRWHLRNSFHKLGANSRENALKKARANHLIGSPNICQNCGCAMNAQARASLLVD